MLQLYMHYFLSSFKYKISFSKGVWSYHSHWSYLYCHYFNFFFYPTGIQVTQNNFGLVSFLGLEEQCPT